MQHRNKGLEEAARSILNEASNKIEIGDLITTGSNRLTKQIYKVLAYKKSGGGEKRPVYTLLDPADNSEFVMYATDVTLYQKKKK